MNGINYRAKNFLLQYYNSTFDGCFFEKAFIFRIAVSSNDTYSGN